MVVDFDAKLASLAAEIVRDAVQDYDRGDMERGLAAAWQMSMFPGGREVTGSFPAITGSFPAIGSRVRLCRRGQPEEGVRAARQAAGRPAADGCPTGHAGAVRPVDGEAGGPSRVAGARRSAGHRG